MTDVKIPRNKENAIKLLAAADKLGLEAAEIRGVGGNYLVSEEIAKEFEAADSADKKAAEKPAAKTTEKKAAAPKAKAKDKE